MSTEYLVTRVTAAYAALKTVEETYECFVSTAPDADTMTAEELFVAGLEAAIDTALLQTDYAKARELAARHPDAAGVQRYIDDFDAPGIEKLKASWEEERRAGLKAPQDVPRWARGGMQNTLITRTAPRDAYLAAYRQSQERLKNMQPQMA
jgi:hypothetical protein